MHSKDYRSQDCDSLQSRVGRAPTVLLQGSHSISACWIIFPQNLYKYNILIVTISRVSQNSLPYFRHMLWQSPSEPSGPVVDLPALSWWSWASEWPPNLVDRFSTAKANLRSRRCGSSAALIGQLLCQSHHYLTGEKRWTILNHGVWGYKVYDPFWKPDRCGTIPFIPTELLLATPVLAPLFSPRVGQGPVAFRRSRPGWQYPKKGSPWHGKLGSLEVGAAETKHCAHVGPEFFWRIRTQSSALASERGTSVECFFFSILFASEMWGHGISAQLHLFKTGEGIEFSSLIRSQAGNLPPSCWV